MYSVEHKELAADHWAFFKKDMRKRFSSRNQIKFLTTVDENIEI
jgi:hypothetical protein